jgi:hypothetical protein
MAYRLFGFHYRHWKVTFNPEGLALKNGSATCSCSGLFIFMVFLFIADPCQIFGGRPRQYY